MSKLSAQEALTLWRRGGLIDETKAQELTRYLEQHAPAGGSGRVLKIFAALGAVLVGSGLILFVASHWGGMRPAARILTLFFAYGLAVAPALMAQSKGYLNVAGALWLLVTLVLGTNIILMGQIFNLSLTFWQAPLVWMAGALVMAWATESRLNAWLAVPLGLLALGWAGGGQGWFTDDQWEFLVDHTGIKSLFPVLGLGLLCIGLLLRGNRSWRFAGPTWVNWGALMIAVPLVIATIDADVLDWLIKMRPTAKHWLVIAAVIGLLLAVLSTEKAPLRLLALYAFLGVFLLILPLLGMVGFEFEDFEALFYLFVALVFAISLGLIWAGAHLHRGALINIGMASAGSIVFIQYFSWSLRLFDRSLAFIAGGVLLILAALWMERKRRDLLREDAS